MAMNTPDTRLKTDKKPELETILAKLSEYSPRQLENALAFLRGIQFAQGVYPSA